MGCSGEQVHRDPWQGFSNRGTVSMGVLLLSGENI